MRALLRSCIAMLALFCAGVAAAQYTFVTLHPSSSWIHSVALSVQGGQQAGYASVEAGFHAALWTGSAASFVDLHPAGWEQSAANSTDGSQQGGFISSALNNQQRPVIWSGTASTMVDLLPPGFKSGYVNAVGGGRQVGGAVASDDVVHPILWSGSALNYVDLKPAGIDFAHVVALAGNQQVGHGAVQNFPYHAMLWTGTAESAVDLHPSHAEESGLTATDGTTQGGYIAVLNGVGQPEIHAAVWSGTAESCVDLHPAGYMYSIVTGVSGDAQIGYGYDMNGLQHPLVWRGTAESVTDVSDLLPAPYHSARLTAIDALGNICGSASTPDHTRSPIGIEAFVLLRAQAPPEPPLEFVGGFKAPINDPATPVSVFKRNAPIPVRFSLRTSTGANVPDLQVTISAVMLGPVEVPINTSEFEGPSDEGGYFRYDAAAELYTYHFRTKNLTAGRQYRITATLPSGQSHSVVVAIR